MRTQRLIGPATAAVALGAAAALVPPLRGNDLGGAATEVSRTGTFTSPPYGYTAEPASTVVTSVTAGAGAGRI